jgi:hypothetical protein
MDMDIWTYGQLDIRIKGHVAVMQDMTLFVHCFKNTTTTRANPTIAIAITPSSCTIATICIPTPGEMNQEGCQVMM